MAIPYNPTTDHGKGFLPLLARAVMFQSGVYIAVHNGWPMNVETARASLDIAIEHARNVGNFLPYVAGTTREYIDDWKRQTEILRDSFRITEGQDPEALFTDAQKDLVKQHAQQTWALMTYLDLDLIGMPDDLTDPGRTP